MRLERIGEDSALIARIEAINVAAFPEIERISIKNFLKMSRKGQLEIAAIFEDFGALSTGGATDKHHAAASENLCAPKQDRGETSQNRDAAGKNSNAASKNSNAAAQNLSGEELVGFCVYRTEQTYKRAVLRHKQLPPRLNADKILRSKAHSGAEFDGTEDEILSDEAKFFSVASGKIAGKKTQPLSGDEILNANADSKILTAADCSTCGAGGKILSSVRRDEISLSAAGGKILRYDESEISSGGGSGIFYVAYLGIDAKFRGLGIGSRLLALISEQNPRAQIVLDVEPPHEDAPNLAQRLRRIEFYGRHGFRRCGKFFNYAGLSFEILAKPPLSAPQQGFDVASFMKFIGAGNKFRFKITDAPLYKN